MAGTMALAEMVADLKVSLHDAARVFDSPDDADFVRFLAQALPDMQYKRPRTLLGSVAVMAGTARCSLADYPDFAAFKTHMWGDLRPVKPWEPGYPGPVPRVSAVHDGQWWLVFDPAPTALQVAAFGACSFWYFGLHVLGVLAADTTVMAADRGLLMLRAQVEAMRELAIRNAGKPVQLRDGLSGTARNSTPAALHELLLNLFKEAR